MIRDLFNECYSGPIKDQGSPDAFSETFCAQCANPTCSRSRGSGTSWVQRISTQEDRLLRNPNFSDPNDPMYREFARQDFQDKVQEALRIHVSTQKGDWSVPTQEEISTEAAKMVGMVPRTPFGFMEQGSPEPDQEDPEPPPRLVDETSVTGLDGKPQARIPAPAPAPPPAVEPDPEPEPSPEPEAPQGSWRVVGDSGSLYQVTLHANDSWECTCSAFRYGKSFCKHVLSMQKKLERAPQEQPPEPTERAPQAAPPAPFRPPEGVAPTFAPQGGAVNTGTPSGGIMLGGQEAPKEPSDPWAPPPDKPKERVIPVGGKIRFGKK